MDIQIKFVNSAQRQFYYATQRNQLFSGGFNNGKSFIGCLKALTLLTTFNNYKFIIARQRYADLKRTTMQTFFKLCPSELIERHNEQDGLTVLKNRSLVHWLHLDGVDEGTLRGMEPNSVLVDQSEETDEKVYDVLDARVGRWDGAEIPTNILADNWPRNPLTGKNIAPSYHLHLCNPDTQFHYLYRKYHPDSLDRLPNHFYVEAEWDRNLSSSETYDNALNHDDEWVSKYVRGEWGVSNAQIHRVWNTSYLDYNEELLQRIRTRGNLFRILDHGDASPTCCLWVASLDGIYIVYREYYVPNQVISEHRKAIWALSENESYSANYADPSIFHRAASKNGGFFSVADEYLTSAIGGKPIGWIPADNNEFATRNRLNELLRPTNDTRHPISGENGFPRIYFIRRSDQYAYGCYHTIKELGSQRRKLLGYYEGKAIYSDDRESSIADHAYDCVRYFVAMHGVSPSIETRSAPRNSFNYFKKVKEKGKTIVAALV